LYLFLLFNNKNPLCVIFKIVVEIIFIKIFVAGENNKSIV
jgi:hypothetical protein